jgi:hypothetical protein
MSEVPPSKVAEKNRVLHFLVIISLVRMPSYKSNHQSLSMLSFQSHLPYRLKHDILLVEEQYYF